MKKNNTLKRTMAGALAVVSLAAYMPITAAVGTPVFNSIVASARDITGNISNIGNLNPQLAVGDVIYGGVTITPGQFNNTYRYTLNLTIDGGNQQTVTGNNNSITLPAGHNYRVTAYTHEQYSTTYTVALDTINTVALTSEVAIPGATGSSGVYTLEEGKSYTVTSTKTLTLDADAKKYISLSTTEDDDGDFVYTLTVKALSADIGVANGGTFKHIHDINVYGYAAGAKEKNKLFVECKGENHFEPKVIAVLGSKESYFYGEAPTVNDVTTEAGGEVVDASEYGVAFGDISMYYTEKDKPNGTHLEIANLEVGKEYTAWAIVPYTVGNSTGTTALVAKDFEYKVRPLDQCDIYYKDASGTETKIGEAGKITNKTVGIPDNSFTYDESEHSPVIVVKDPFHKDASQKDVVVTEYELDLTGEYKNRATDAGTYSFRLNADVDETDNYSDELIVLWAIDTADSGIGIEANPHIIYDGEKVTLADDFKITGENADKATGYATLEFAPGYDGESAGEQKATFKVNNPNYQAVSKGITFYIEQREVKLTPDDGQEITYSDAFNDKIPYTAETRNGDRGIIESDLTGLTDDNKNGSVHDEFFGNQFLVGDRTDGVEGTFSYATRKNNAGSYGYKANENVADANSKAANYDVKFDDTKVFTIKQKELTDAMFTATNGTEFEYNEREQGVTWKASDIIDSTEFLTASDYDVYGTDTAVFDGKYAVEFFGKGNYTGSAYLNWLIGLNDDYVNIFDVSASDFTYNEKNAEENGKIVVSGYPADAKIQLSYARKDKDGNWVKMDEIPVEAGEYKVYAVATKKSYAKMSDEATFKINEDGVNITVKETEKTFGDADPDFTWDIDFVPPRYQGRSVTVEGTIKIVGQNNEKYEGNVGTYKFDTSDLVVKIDGDVAPSFTVDASSSSFKVNPRKISDDDVVSEGAVFDENSGIADILKGFKVVAKGADGQDTELVYTPSPLLQSGDYTLVTGSQSKTESGDFIVTVKGIGNYTGYAETVIKVDAGYNVSVVNGIIKSKGTSTARLNKDSKATVIADEAPEGKKFGYWKKNGSTASYNASYSFVVSSNIELEAVYVDKDDDFEKSVQAKIISSEKIVEDGVDELLIKSEIGVPEGYKIVKAGLVATNNRDKAKTLSVDTVVDVDAVSGNKDTFIKLEEGITARNYLYKWTKTNVKEGDVWYVKSCVVYKDANDVEYIKYGDLVAASFGKVDVLEEAEVKTSRNITGTRAYFDTTDNLNMVEFISEVSVPADCKIIEGGVVATDVEADKDKLDVNNCKFRRSNATKHQNVTAHTYIYTWTKKQEASYGNTWYAKSYLIYETPIGNRYTVYGDEVAECTFAD